MSEAIKIPQSIHFRAEDHDPGETIVLFSGEPDASAAIGTIYNFEDFPCLEDDQAGEVHKAARATTEKIIRSYNSHDDLLAALCAAPILSQYHGQAGFDVERFVTDYETWKATARAAIAKAEGEPS